MSIEVLPSTGASTREKNAAMLFNHASKNPYLGPSKPAEGSLFGWPLSELAEVVLGAKNWPLKIEAISELKSRIMPVMSMSTAATASDNLRGRSRSYSLEQMLAMRMRWEDSPNDRSWAPGFEHVAVHRTEAGDKVHVWVITKDAQSVVLEDGADMFPSDALVTKLNLMKG